MPMTLKGNWGYRIEKIKYTPDAADKLRDIKRTITLQYGGEKAKEIVEEITRAVRGLAGNEKKGPSVENMFGVLSDYRYIFVSKNYVFYDIQDDAIRVINIYHEKEDFMWFLFGIDTTSQETIDYWGEY